MAIVPQPHREVDLISSGAQSLGNVGQQAYSTYQEQARQDAPGDPILDKFINRLMAGEDPAKLGAEARADPSLQQLLQKIASQGGAGPSPQSMVPDVGAPRGQPQVMPPGTVNPAGGPQSLGSMGSPQQGQSLGAPAPQPRPQAPQSQMPQGPLPPANYETGGVQVSRPAAPQEPGAQDPKLRTVREQQRLMGIIPTLAAGQSRENVAGMQTDARRDAATLRSNTTALIAIMKENGLQDRDISNTLTKIEGLDVKQQIAVLQAITDLEKSRIGAGATLGAAATRASTGEDSAEKELRTSITALANITSKPEWQKDSASMSEFTRLTARINELQKSLGRPAGSTAPRPKQDVPKSTSSSASTKTTQPGGTIKVRNKKTGQTGSIPAQNFDPSKYDKLQ